MPQRQRVRNWSEWHEEYDRPGSRLSRRLAVVQEYIRRALDLAPAAPRIVSMCAGEGRDLLPVLAEHAKGRDAHALLVELDPRIIETARANADALGLANVTFACADAGDTSAFAAGVPADIVLACGVFGNVTDGDIARTAATIPSLCAASALVLWTRGAEPDRDVIAHVRDAFAGAGFEELALHAEGEETFRVGMCRLTAEPAPYRQGVRMFSFVPHRTDPRVAQGAPDA